VQVIPGGMIAPWNDVEGRTHVEVVNIIDLALKVENNESEY